MNNARVTLSVVIVSFNTRSYLGRCLASLKKHTPPFSMETIVVDNNSSDKSVDLVRAKHPEVRLIANSTNKGFGPALNQGIRAGQSEFVLLLNSDTELFPHTLTTLIGVLQRRPEAGAVAPLFVNGDGKIIQMSWGWNPLFWGEIIQKFFAPRNIQRSVFRRRLAERIQSRERKVGILCGAAMMFRRKTLEEIGLLDEDYLMYFEDSDLCTRAWKKGWACVFTPTARIVHHLGKSSADPTSRLTLLYRQSQVLYYNKHGSSLDRFLLGIYLRFKFWRIYFPPFAGDSEAQTFYAALRGVVTGQTRVTL